MTDFRTDAARQLQHAVFYGLGSDGTVAPTRTPSRSWARQRPLQAQGYFVYDSKKAGAVTISHLRFGPQPIHSTYLIGKQAMANFVACHQPVFARTLRSCWTMPRPTAVFLLNTPAPPDKVWDTLPHRMQRADHRQAACSCT